MTGKQHIFTCTLEWTGNRGQGTADYKAYGRDHLISAAGKPVLRGSSATVFRGDADRYNPEELLVAALSSCHMLWYLHLAAEARIVVMSYRDEPDGVMTMERDGAGQFAIVTLRPVVEIAAGSDRKAALATHASAHAKCFIARSVNFPVIVEPVIT